MPALATKNDRCFFNSRVAGGGREESCTRKYSILVFMAQIFLWITDLSSLLWFEFNSETTAITERACMEFTARARASIGDQAIIGLVFSLARSLEIASVISLFLLPSLHQRM
jgi:hypothetical protein